VPMATEQVADLVYLALMVVNGAHAEWVDTGAGLIVAGAIKEGPGRLVDAVSGEEYHSVQSGARSCRCDGRPVA
jgi:hypothetical protein